MSKIRIKNFGPIKEGFDTEDGFMDIKKVTVFIGDQGTGKSTVAKLISTLMWMEKALNRNDIEINSVDFGYFQQICRFQLISNYFSPETEIEYEGDLCSLKFSGQKLFEKNSNIKADSNFIVPQLMYVSAERNFLTTIENVNDLKYMPGHLFAFAEELHNAQKEVNGGVIELPIRDYKYEFDPYSRQSIVSSGNKKLNLLEASSGLQSLIPLYLVSRNLALSLVYKSKDDNISINQLLKRNKLLEELWEKKSLMSDKDLEEQTYKIFIKFRNRCFINIVEEPEQNLFPTSQRQILNSLVEFANMNEGNKLIMTTHSPYIISYLGIAVQGHNLLEKINAAGNPEGFKERMEHVVPEKSVIAPEDLVIYQLKENGTISRLPDYEGIPADKNYLNQSLIEGNQLFGALLEIEEDL